MAPADSVGVPRGLSSDQARAQLNRVGPNSMPDVSEHPVWRAVQKLWAPVPWMLEAAIVLELLLHKLAEAGVIAGLLTFNAVLGFFQEGRAQATLAALKSRLALNASVNRDGTWEIIPAVELVPGDLIKMSLGSVVAADVRIVNGSVLLDQSMLTGESVPVEMGRDARTFAGALVRRGEASAVVLETGPRTKFGHTAELVRTAHSVSSQQKAVLRVVRNLGIFNAIVICAIVIFARFHNLAWTEIFPLVLTAVLAAIPVALPATFTLATALGARSLAKLGVLPTRLSAIDEAATIDVLCVDKTGTLTCNELAVSAVWPATSCDVGHLLHLACLASAEGGQDPVDGAIRAAARDKTDPSPLHLAKFIPFDPANKMSEASATDKNGESLRIVKGAYAAVIALARPAPDALVQLGEMEAKGLRVLAVAAGAPSATLGIVGLLGLSDPPRSDSAAFVSELKALGIRTLMVTGDASATAAVVAKAVGLEGTVCPAGTLPDGLRPEQYGVFAGVFPEGKNELVQVFQGSGHTVGMCGDGANDAPALRQAQMGVAVSSATDVAKSAAGIVLTTAGLSGIVAAVKEGRCAFQRILTYAINSVTKKIVNVLYLSVGLIVTGHAILTPTLMVIIMITGDFLGMSVTTDHVHPSAKPNQWQIGKLTRACSILGGCILLFCTLVLLVGKFFLRLDLLGLQTLTMVTLVFSGEATLYSIRERRRLWSSQPSKWVYIATIADILIISVLAVSGVRMQALHGGVVGSVLLAAVLFAFALDLVKTAVFRHYEIT